MSYSLGIDLGTTYTAAAVRVGERVDVVQLGSRHAEIPSSVFVAADGAVLVGEAAERRGVAEPSRLAKEFKRRVGDPVPLLVGGAPYSPHALMARLVEHVLTTVTQQRESAPTSTTMTCPANWGPYKRDLLDQAVRLADLDGAQILAEPTAAALEYAAGEQVRAGEVVAVYDLGGGTFDAAVLEKTQDGFVVLGHPAGIEQLGGVDFDEAIFRHVVNSVGSGLANQDPSEPEVLAAFGRLRREATEAKEALSYDSAVDIPLSFPGLHTSIRLTRAEFETMIAPAIAETLACFRRTLASANLVAGDIRSILLAGGSSRIPLVGLSLTSEFRRPLALDPAPEHSIARGAARAFTAARPADADPEITAPASASAAVGPPPLADPESAGTANQLSDGARSATDQRHAAAPNPSRNSKRRRSVVLAVAAAMAVVIIAGAATWTIGALNSAGDNAAAGDSAATELVWTRKADLPFAVEGAAVAAFENQLWVAGGLRNDPARSKMLGVLIYDPASDSWSPGPSLPKPISHAALVAASSGLYFLGGYIQEGGSREVLRLNDAHTAWEAVAPLPETRVAGAAAFDGARIVFAGGTRSDQTAGDEVWSFDGQAWSQVGTMSHGRQKLAALSNGAGMVWILGGHDQQTGVNYDDVDVVSDGRLLPPGSATPLEPAIDSAAAVTVDGAGHCLVGGQTPTGYNDWWCDQQGTAAALPKLDPQRAGLGAAVVGNTVYVVGGYGDGFEGTVRVEAFTAPSA